MWRALQWTVRRVLRHLRASGLRGEVLRRLRKLKVGNRQVLPILRDSIQLARTA